MITYSGVHIQKTGGETGTPTAVDIAVHAGRICRFGGAAWSPLLPHLVFVGLMAYKRSGLIANLLWGFLHDAHEIATSDVPKPFKCDCIRREQIGLDDRIYDRFCQSVEGEKYGCIDFDLIKQCDGDACDIEAVQLGLPGYAEISMRCAKDYGGRMVIHSDPEDVQLFDRIRDQPLWLSTIFGEMSPGVVMFADALKLAESGDYEGFLGEVKSWELL